MADPALAATKSQGIPSTLNPLPRLPEAREPFRAHSTWPGHPAFLPPGRGRPPVGPLCPDTFPAPHRAPAPHPPFLSSLRSVPGRTSQIEGSLLPSEWRCPRCKDPAYFRHCLCSGPAQSVLSQCRPPAWRDRCTERRQVNPSAEAWAGPGARLSATHATQGLKSRSGEPSPVLWPLHPLTSYCVPPASAQDSPLPLTSFVPPCPWPRIWGATSLCFFPLLLGALSSRRPSHFSPSVRLHQMWPPAKGLPDPSASAWGLGVPSGRRVVSLNAGDHFGVSRRCSSRCGTGANTEPYKARTHSVCKGPVLPTSYVLLHM